MLSTVRARWQAVVYSLWFFPGLIVVSLAGLSILLQRIDRSVKLEGPIVFGGEADAARQILSVIAGSIVTVAGVVFSVTIVVLQLVSSQFSPRLLRNFLRDRVTQLTAGVFIGTFVYSLLVLSEVRVAGERSQGFVPALSVTVAVALGLVSFAILLLFVHHIAQSIQISSIAAAIGSDALEAIESLYPSQFGGRVEEDADDIVREWREDGRRAAVRAPRVGYVQKLNVEDVVRELPDSDLRLHVHVCPGDFVTEETALMHVWAGERLDEKTLEKVTRAVSVEPGRDIGQDAAFAIRQLADIAIKAMSPSVNDPTTAVTSIRHMGAALTSLAARELPAPVRRLEDGRATVVARRRTFEEYLDGLVEISRYASKDARVVEALLEALSGVADAASSVGAANRSRAASHAATDVALPGLEDARTERDRERIEAALERVAQSDARAARAAASEGGT